MYELKSKRVGAMFGAALRLLSTDGNKISDGTIELQNVAFTLTDPTNRFVRSSLMPASCNYIKREILWYFTGSRSPAMVATAKRWKKVTVDGEVNSNYGDYLFGDGYIIGGEMPYVVTELMKKDSRRAVAFIGNNSTYAQMWTGKDFPCTTTLQFFKRNGKLDLNVYMRSNDLIYGWRNDLPFFTLLQEMVAADIGVELGTYTHIAGSLHIYPKHQYLLDRFSEDKFDADISPMPPAGANDYYYFAYKRFLKVAPVTPLQQYLMSGNYSYFSGRYEPAEWLSY